jgi:hypothetical protein
LLGEALRRSIERRRAKEREALLRKVDVADRLMSALPLDKQTVEMRILWLEAREAIRNASHVGE